MEFCRPRSLNETFNPFINSNFTDISFSLSSNNGRWQNDEFADILYDEGRMNVFKISDFCNNKDFCWNDFNFLSINIDGIDIKDILLGLEEEQIFVLPCNILDKIFRDIFDEKNLLIGRYVNNEQFLEIIEMNKNDDIWEIDNKYDGKSKLIPTSVLFNNIFL